MLLETVNEKVNGNVFPARCLEKFQFRICLVSINTSEISEHQEERRKALSLPYSIVLVTY